MTRTTDAAVTVTRLSRLNPFRQSHLGEIGETD
jgi:hypothetical protein